MKKAALLFVYFLLATGVFGQEPKLMLPIGHTDAVNSAQYSPDGKRVVTASKDRTAKIWDAKTGALLADLKGHTDEVNDAAFSPDGKKVITASYDSTAKIWSTENGNLLAELNGHAGFVKSASFSPDGKKAITVSLHPLSLTYTIKIWDAQSDAMLLAINGRDTDNFDQASFSSDSKRIITVSNEWDAQTGSRINSVTRNAWGLGIVSFTPDGKKIIMASNDNPIHKIWDVQSAVSQVVLMGHSYNAAISPDGKKIVTVAGDHNTKIWNVQTGALLADLKGYSRAVNSASFSPDSKTIVTASYDHTVKIWDAQTGTLLNDLKGHTKLVSSVSFTEDGKTIVTASLNKKLDIGADSWDAATSVLQDNSHATFFYNAPFIFAKKSKDKLWEVNDVGLFSETDLSAYPSFSPDKRKKVETVRYDAYITFKAPKTQAQLIILRGHSDWVNSATFSPDGKKVVTSSNDHTAKVWDAQTGALLADLKGHSRRVRSAWFSPDGNNIVTASDDHTARIWNANTGVMLVDLKGHTDVVNCASFSPGGKVVVTASHDETCKLWNAESGKLLYTFLTVDSTDYFNQIPSGYYMCTQNAAKLLHYVTKNLEVITFDQLDIKYNRPDKVLEAIGCPDTALIHAYHRAYEKRIKKLGIDTNSFKSGYSVPKSDFINRDQIEQQPEQKGDRLTLHISGSDSTYTLDRFNVWVNQVPVYGIKGISLKGKHKSGLDTTVTINLSQGDNRIETSVTDANGTESYHIPLYVKYVPDKPVDTLIHFVGIGINKFKDKNYNLSWSVKDIHDLALKFKEKYGSKCIIDTLFDENVTTDNVIALKKDLLKSSVNDKVIIAYSGHGLLSKDYDYFLSTYNVDFKDPAKKGLPYDALENLLDSIPARKKLMLIDACHSGEVDKEEMARYESKKNTLKDNGIIPRGAEIELVEKSGMSMASSFELMKQLFVNVGKSTGATIISAAGGVQYALEKNDLKNGVFTYSILESMQKNPHVSISALKRYVDKRVTELTAGMQVPTTRNETDVVDWEVW